MSLYGEAVAAIKSVILIDERVQSVARKVDRLADEVRDTRDRLIRLETIVEITRRDGAVLRIGREPVRGEADPPGKT